MYFNSYRVDTQILTVYLVTITPHIGSVKIWFKNMQLVASFSERLFIYAWVYSKTLWNRSYVYVVATITQSSKA